MILKHTQEEAELWRIHALQLAATLRAVIENVPEGHPIRKTLQASLDRFNQFYGPMVNNER